MPSRSLEQAVEKLKKADSVCVLTGAGVSKESGVPTFRDAQTGLWAKYDPQQLATPQAYQANPKLVWDWYTFRRQMVRNAKPNPGHKALADLEQYFTALPIITQNVDDLHEQAGSHDVIHLHGNIAANKCFYNCQGNPTTVDLSTIAFDPNNGPPTCPHCGRKSVRPDVVWFGEMLSKDNLIRAKEISDSVDVMLIVGTSGLVQPAASLPTYAKHAGATLIEVNPDFSMVTPHVHIKLEGPSGQILPTLVEALTGA
jgi:NAD-dependent deacetylase